MTDANDLRTQTAKVLAGLFNREFETKHLLQDAGVPIGELLPWGTMAPMRYWTETLANVESGVIPPEKLADYAPPDGIVALLQIALKKRFPGNRDLPGLIGRWEEYLAQTAGTSPGDLNVLFLAANAVDRMPLRIGHEFKVIQDRISGAAARRINLDPKWAAEPECLMKLLQGRPPVVHFSGHAEPDGSLVLEDKDGNSSPLPPKILGDVFRAVNRPLKDRQIRCAVLNACYSEPAATAISHSVDVVVATKGEIADPAAIDFVKEFYGGLAAGRSVGDAVEAGKAQMAITAHTWLTAHPNATAAERATFSPDLVVVRSMKRVDPEKVFPGQ